MKSRLCLSLFATLLALSACAHNPALDKGDKYYAAGDWQQAEKHYTEALNADPDSSEARTKLERAQRKKLESLRVQAEQAIATRQFLTAIDRAWQAHHTMPRAQTTGEILKIVMAAARGHSKSLIDNGDYATAIHLWATIRDRIPPFREEAVSKHGSLVEKEVSKLIAEADEARAKDLDGAALLAWAQIVELSPTTFHHARFEREKSMVAARTRYPISIAFSPGVLARATFDRVQKRLEEKSPAIEIVDEDQASKALLRFEVVEPTYHTTKGSRSQKKKYQSGTREVPNPRRAEVEEKVTTEENRLAELEQKLAQKEAEVLEEQGKVTSATANITSLAISIAGKARERDALAAQVEKQRQRVEDARARVRETPLQVEAPVYSDFVYEVRSVTRHGETRLSGQVTHTDGRPAIDFDIPVSDRKTDTGHDAHPQVDLAEDSLVVPSDRSVESALSAAVAKRLHDFVLSSFDSYRADFLNRAEKTDSELERLHYYVLHVVADPERAEARALSALSQVSGLKLQSIVELGGHTSSR